MARHRRPSSHDHDVSGGGSTEGSASGGSSADADARRDTVGSAGGSIGIGSPLSADEMAERKLEAQRARPPRRSQGNHVKDSTQEDSEPS